MRPHSVAHKVARIIEKSMDYASFSAEHLFLFSDYIPPFLHQEVPPTLLYHVFATQTRIERQTDKRTDEETDR